MRSPRGLALGGALAVLLLTATGVVARNLASDPGAIERLVLLGRHERAEVVELPASVRDALRPDGSRRAETAAGREVLLDARGSLLVRVASSASPVTASFDDAPAPAEAVAVGPSLDSTDDPATESVYLLGADGTVYEYGPAASSFVTLADGTATLVGTIDTSDGPGVGAWDPDSPDPSGITWWPAESRLVVVDGEVDEDTGAGFHDVNGWLSTTAGQVTATFDTTASTNEPVGVTVDTTTGSLYISEDSNHRVFELDPGADGEVGTADDSLGLA
ncbi:MAG TPA: hypothetical protein VFH63_05040, partial [candidate division Zixibacteria bacterium]|nr:hypothetical protein [candidate division Zixibacteria bacterium]